MNVVERGDVRGQSAGRGGIARRYTDAGVPITQH